MYPQLILLSNPACEYDQRYQQIMKSGRYEHNIMHVHNKQIIELNMNQKYIDSSLTQRSLKQINNIKHKLFKVDQFDTVIVAPLKKSLRTCYQLFRHQYQKSQHHHHQQNPNKPNIQFYVEPLLADRLNSTNAIGDLSQSKYSQLYSLYAQFFNNFKQKISKSNWMNDILPPRIVNQLPNNCHMFSCQQYVKLLKSTHNNNQSQKYTLQTQYQFAQRILNLKQTLVHHYKANTITHSNKKILIIASAQVLNHLAATDFHQNGQPVNPLRLQPGDIDIAHLVVNGLQSITQFDNQTILPFCR